MIQPFQILAVVVMGLASGFLIANALAPPWVSRLQAMKWAARCGCFDETCHKKGEPHERWPWDWR